MIRFKQELILRLAEAPAVQQWLKVEQSRVLARKQNRKSAEEIEGPEEHQWDGVIKEKMFLLTSALQINTNPAKLPSQTALREMPYLKGWIGNQYLCQVTNRSSPLCTVTGCSTRSRRRSWRTPGTDGCPSETDLRASCWTIIRSIGRLNHSLVC